MIESRKISRCAIYTRKSTEHNLDLEFNSLDAQREACEAYIKSQSHEGWRLVPGDFNDGGISGASLSRPALQALMVEITAGKIDVVVVYKVDRLTRSLADFAKLVELFDKHGVSFVSVTQSFNTTTSMGRLTLNVLLSFAQFEREVIGERVRDKIAASKRKGLWMGGPVPLGYESQDKKLVIVPREAETVRWIFQQYLELGAIGPLLQVLDRRGLTTKQRKLSSGRLIGGGRFGKGGLNHLLKNRCYVGEVEHRGGIHAGCHEPIVARDLFDAVQAKLEANNVNKKLKLKSSPFLLAGLIFDSAGNRMTPSHTVKKGARYRYYISQAVVQRRKHEAGTVSRIPAPDIEALIESAIKGRPELEASSGEALRVTLEERVSRVIIKSDAVEVQFKDADLAADIRPDGQVTNILSIPWKRKTFKADKGLLNSFSETEAGDPMALDAAFMAIAKSRVWIGELMEGGSIAEIAKREGKGERQIRLLAPLAFVSPSAVQALIDGTARATTVTTLARNVPLLWEV